MIHRNVLFGIFIPFVFLGNLPIALTLMVRLSENFIIDSPIMAPRPQNHPPSKSLYIYILYMWWVCEGVCMAILWVRCGPQRSPIAIKLGTKFCLDVNKNWLLFSDFSPKWVEIVGCWNLKKFITTLIWMIPVWLQMTIILLINLNNLYLKSFSKGG